MLVLHGNRSLGPNGLNGMEIGAQPYDCQDQWSFAKIYRHESSWATMAGAEYAELLRDLPRDFYAYLNGHSEAYNLLEYASYDTGHEEPEFGSRIFGRYHLPQLQRGSAPRSPHYWLEGVLVLLDLEFACEIDVYQAVFKVNEIGQAMGKTTFSSVITAPTEVVLVRVFDKQVQHTKVMTLVDLHPRRRGCLPKRKDHSALHAIKLTSTLTQRPRRYILVTANPETRTKTIMSFNMPRH